VFVFEESAHAEAALVDPRTLARYDLVIASFSALRRGYHDAVRDYSSERARHSLYSAFPPSFACVEFSALVVDESQNVESSPAGEGGVVLRMTQVVRSRRRVSVSGTPIGGSRLSDLFCLSRFLGVAPTLSRNYGHWMKLLGKPRVPIPTEIRMKWLHGLYCPIFLRRTKAVLFGELGLKSSTVSVKRLRFSDFEVCVT
jgi:hypothetical protein